MTNNGQFEFLDMVTIANFIIAVLNYDENLDQEFLSKELDKITESINGHLKEQDRKLDLIMRKIGVDENG